MADSNVPSLPTATALDGSEIFYLVQGGGDAQENLLNLLAWILGGGGPASGVGVKKLTLGKELKTLGAYDVILEAVADVQLKLPPASCELASLDIKESTISTTDATPAALRIYTTSAGKTHLISGYVYARWTGGVAGSAGDSAAYRVEIIAKDIAGTVTIVGSRITIIGETQASWDVTLGTGASAVKINVVGEVDNNINWAWSPIKASIIS
jgi:hypothetical protein